MDQHAGCPKAAEEGYCSDQKIVEVCPGSCKKCRKKMGSESSDATKCVDTWEFCPTLEAGCGNSSFVQENCRATCKQCGNVDKQTDGEEGCRAVLTLWGTPSQFFGSPSFRGVNLLGSPKAIAPIAPLNPVLNVEQYFCALSFGCDPTECFRISCPNVSSLLVVFQCFRILF